MSEAKEHVLMPELKRQLAEKKIDRREFVRYACLLGMSASAAYALAGVAAPAPASAQAPAKGGTIRLGMRVQELTTPHTSSWIEGANSFRQSLDYLTQTGSDNVTRPALVEKWEASEDLKTWTLRLRKDVKWHNGRQFNADDVIWNFKRVLDPKVGSSTVGLMKDFLLKEVDSGQKDDKGNPKKTTELWDAQAIEKKDDFTVVLNGKTAQIAIPEHLFHYPFPIMDPAENGVFKVGANGTGAFSLVEHEVGRRSVYKARPSYWGGGPNIDTLEIIDTGDEVAAKISAMASKQIDALYLGEITMVESMKALQHVQLYDTVTAYTAVARVHSVKPFDDKRVRQAMRWAIDAKQTLQVSHKGLGLPAEHHHVSPVHPEYAKLPPMTRDVAKAKKLLADAGYPNGIDVEIACRPQPDWELIAVQNMVEQWKEAGIRVKINQMPSTQYWEVWTKVPFGFTTWAHRPLGVMSLALAYRTGVPWNESNWSNKQFDDLLTQAEATVDVEKRRAIMAKLETIMQEEGPIVQPVWRALFTYMDKKIQGFKMHPTGYMFAHQWWIKA